MAPKRETALQKAARMSRASQLMFENYDLQIIVASVKNKGAVIRGVKDFLKSNGWLIEPTGEEIEASGAKKAIADDEDDDGQDEDDADDDEDPKDPESDPLLAGTLHRNKVTWLDIPPRTFALMLAYVEGQSMHLSLLRAQRKPGQKEVPMQLMAELFERFSMMDPTLPIGSERRLHAITRNMMNMNEENNRPLQNLIMPPKWNGKDAVYVFTEKPGKQIWLTARNGDGTETSVEVDAKVFKGSTVGDLKVDKNFSVRRGTATSKKDATFSISCRDLLYAGMMHQSQIPPVSTGVMKKPALALELGRNSRQRTSPDEPNKVIEGGSTPKTPTPSEGLKLLFLKPTKKNPEVKIHPSAQKVLGKTPPRTCKTSALTLMADPSSASSSPMPSTTKVKSPSKAVRIADVTLAEKETAFKPVGPKRARVA